MSDTCSIADRNPRPRRTLEVRQRPGRPPGVMCASACTFCPRANLGADSGKLQTMSANVDSELIGLFGHWTFATAQVKRLDELKVDPDAVKAAAQQVIEQRDNPTRQRAIVDAMDEDTAVALCLWLRDPANASGLLKQARAKPRRRG
jgi:hypothetical protein